MPLTISDLMSKMPGAFLPEKAVGLDAVIQFKFTGAESGDWYATIKDGKCAVAQGESPSPKMTLTADSGRLHQNVHWRTRWYASLYARQA